MNTKWFSSFFLSLHENGGPHSKQDEQGQSIVILAFALIGLLAFAGIAVDVGFVFARSTQLQAAVDAAALAGVTELSGGNLADADNRAAQFLRANGIPISITQNFDSDQNMSELNATEYTLTATWPVDLFFLRVIGLEDVAVTKAATAAYFPLADIYASRRVEEGVVSTAGQGVFGPDICTAYGDAFSPRLSPDAPGLYTYQYRIYIPPDYGHDVIRIEILDPDSINTDENSTQVYFSAAALAYDPVEFLPEGKPMDCPGDPTNNQRNPCVLETGELDIVEATRNDPNPIGLDEINPYWFVRMDENRGQGAGHGNTNCATPGNYTPRYNTQTVYEAWYWAQNPDGSIERINVAAYTGQVGDTIRDNGGHETDRLWVSPGAPARPPYQDVPADFGSFEISLSADMPNVLTDPGTGARYIQFDVTTISGASENVFEIWAGPPIYTDVNPEVNARNIAVTNNRTSHYSDGVVVFAMGRLPMNSIYNQPLNIPLLFVSPNYIGQTVYVSLFDSDAGTKPPITFFFDSIAFEEDDSEPDGVNWANTDWAYSYGGTNDTNPLGRCFAGGPGYGDQCNNRWIEPPYGLEVPGDLSQCDYEYLNDNPNDTEYRMENCTPYYGGRLYARYNSSTNDTYVWEITLSGLPFLRR